MLKAGLGNGEANDQLFSSKERKRGSLTLKLGDNGPDTWKLERGKQSKKGRVQIRDRTGLLFS